MGLLGAGIEVAKAMMPPKTNELDAQQRWRWVVFAALIGAYGALAVHIALACGLLPSMYSGFALASDQKSVQKRVDVIASLSIQHEIRDLTFDLCHEKDQKKRDQFNDEIAKLQKEYYDIEKVWYRVPECGLL